MSDPRSTDPLRRPYLRGATARANTAGSADRGWAWMTLWTWLIAIAAVALILGLVFGYSRSGLVQDMSGEPATSGAAPSLSTHSGVAPAGDVRAPAPAAPADDDP
jgi:hypothetical protein